MAKMDVDAILLKLAASTATTNGNNLTEDEVILAYERNSDANGGVTYFSTSSIRGRMDPKKEKLLNEKIQNNGSFPILFVKATYADVKIAYCADVIEICPSKDKVPAAYFGIPENAYPQEFSGEEQRLWLAVKNIRWCTDINIGDLYHYKDAKKDLFKSLKKRSTYLYVCFK